MTALIFLMGDSNKVSWSYYFFWYEQIRNNR